MHNGLFLSTTRRQSPRTYPKVLRLGNWCTNYCIACSQTPLILTGAKIPNQPSAENTCVEPEKPGARPKLPCITGLMCLGGWDVKGAMTAASRLPSSTRIRNAAAACERGARGHAEGGDRNGRYCTAITTQECQYSANIVPNSANTMRIRMSIVLPLHCHYRHCTAIVLPLY